ncbi:hypothetical protein [Rhodococcoides corynebacterioides]|uniref:hypothetical protein n=1 Tax=Rhodococcoides corynebacterioides TaxID=53972 RepID=UPI003ADD517B
MQDRSAGVTRKRGFESGSLSVIQQETGLGAAARINSSLILARAHGDAATFECIVDRTRQQLLAPVA